MQVIPPSPSTMATTSTSTIFDPDYTLTPTQSREGHPPILLGVSPTNPCHLSPTPRAMPTATTGQLGSPMPSPTPRRRLLSGSRSKGKARNHGNAKPSVKYDTYPACMEGGIAHEARSQALAHAGSSAERHLRAAAALFESALFYQPAPGAALRLATVQYHLSAHCRPSEATDLLRAARHALLDQDTGPATEARAAICARLATLLRLPSDTQSSEAGQAASEALDAFEDVAAERMDRASTLSKSEFEAETPALAATFLALAEAAAAVCTLSPDAESADAHAELEDHALAHAANMATLSRAPALVTHIQLTSARLAAERLRYFAKYGEDGGGWTELLLEMGILASQTRDRAQKLRGSRGSAAAEQAAEAVKLLAETRVMYAQCLGLSSERPPLPFSPYSARSIPTAPTTPISATLATPMTAAWSLSPPDPTPGLSSGSGSWSSSTGSPPIPEEPEPEDVDQPMPKIVSNTPGSSSSLLSPTHLSPTRKRAPPPPPLKLVQLRPPRPPPALTPLHPPPLSPLNPARRASDLPARPRLFRGPSFNSPRRASWMTPSLEEPLSPMSSARAAPTPPLSSVQQQWNQLAAAGKEYKLALSMLSNANLPPAERARRKSELLFAVATTALARANIAPLIVNPTPGLTGSQGGSLGHVGSLSGSYFSPTAPHASAESIKSLARFSPNHSHANRSLSLQSGPSYHPHSHSRHYSYPRSPTIPAFVRLAPATPRPDPRSGTRVAGAAALRATAEVYAAWAAREVGWSAIIDPSGAGADRRTGAAGADEAGLRAVLLAVRVWWVRASAGEEADDAEVEVEAIESDDEEHASASGELLSSGHEEKESSGAFRESPGAKGPSTRTFGLYPPLARRIIGVLSRLREEGAGADDVHRFVAPFTLGEEEWRFWTEVEDVLSA